MRIITIIAALGVVLGAIASPAAAQVVVETDEQAEARMEKDMADLMEGMTPEQISQSSIHARAFTKGLTCFHANYERLDDPATAIDVMVETILMHCLVETGALQSGVPFYEVQADLSEKMGQLFATYIMVHRADARDAQKARTGG